MARAHDLVTEIEEATRKLTTLQSEFHAIQRTCPHDFGETRYVPEGSGGYRDPGDPPGTMGVDRRLPMDVPRTEVKKWERVCALCTLKQTTTNTRPENRPSTIRGTTATQEVPDFPQPARY